MKLKEYLEKLSVNIDADTDNPAEIVQQLACLAGMRLSSKRNSLPVRCGRGGELDMDIVNAGIVEGLEKLRKFNGDMATIRAFLYKRIAGAMYNYAWKTENRVSHNIWRSVVNEVHSAERYSGEPIDGEDGDYYPHVPDSMRADSYELSTEIEEEEAAEEEARAEAIRNISAEDAGLLVRYYQLKEDKQKIADSLNISLASLYSKIQRIKQNILIENDV